MTKLVLASALLCLSGILPSGLFAAPRVWWTLKTFGARDVRILDGGLPKWKLEGLPLEDGPVVPRPRHFTARLDHAAVSF